MTYRSSRFCGALVAAALGTAAIGSTAQAEVIGDSVADNHNVTIFANIDLVAVFGDAPGVVTRVEALRNDVRIGWAQGPAVELGEFPAPNAGGMEVNHGVEGAAGDGDCWASFTPDLMAGDVIRVTRGTAVEQVRVDDITIDGMAFNAPNGDVHVTGRAALANGAPIPIADLDAGEVRQAVPRYRANPSEVIRTPGTTDGWTAIYKPPFTPFSEVSPALSVDERRQALLTNEHAMGYGHVAPLPAETQLADGLEGSGPAIGCEGSAGQSNAVESASDQAINVTSGDLTVSGTSMTGGVTDAGAVDGGSDIDGATITASDGTTSVTAPATGDFDGPGDWSANFTRAQLDTLADGPIEVSGSWNAGGTPIGGKSITLSKDIEAPELTATRDGASVSLSAGPGDRITYRTDGQPQTDGDAVYSGPIALPFGTTVLSVRVKDDAGNVTDRTLTYTVDRPADPPAAAGGSSSSSSSPAPIVAPPVQTLTAPSRTAPALVASARLVSRARLATVRRRGLSATFATPSGARFAVARLYRVNGKRRTLVATKSMTVEGASRESVRFAGRRLKAGRYAITLRVGAGRTSLGSPITIQVTVVR